MSSFSMLKTKDKSRFFFSFKETDKK